jgi:hypothetical protein
VSTKSQTPEPAAATAQELSEFLLELSIALNRHAVYPDSHPSLAGSAQGVVDRLQRILQDRTSVSIGVARHQLIIEGVATDESHPVLRSVAERLHKQHIGALMFSRGVTVDDLRAVLRLLTVEAEQMEIPLGLSDPARLRARESIRLYPLTYGDLELVDGGDGDDGEAAEESPASQLWIGLARAAIAQDDATANSNTDSNAVAQAINEHEAAPAYDQIIVGYLLQLATQLRESGADSARTVRSRVSNLITRLDPDTLQRLVEMGGDFAQRKKFLLDTTDALAVDSVLEVLKAAAHSSQQTISSSMLRMLTKMSANAGGARGEAADEAMREQVKELIEGWSLEDPNPDAYTRALESMARTASNVTTTAEAQYPAEPMRLIRMALEVDAVGVPFWRAVHHVLADQRLPELIDLLEHTPEGSTAAAALWERLETADTIRYLLTTDPVDFPTLDRLIRRLPEETVISLLLDRISESSSRATRMGVFQRLSSKGARVIPPIIERLRDDRWYVQRNMLALLNEIGSFPEDFAPLRYAKHDRPTVRREALQLATNSPADRERAICLAFGDVDERAVRVGLRAAQDGMPSAAVPLAIRCLDVAEFSPELRAQVLRAVRNVRTPEVLERLIGYAQAGKTLLGKPKLASKSPEMLSALSGLARNWSQHARVVPLLERARESGDPEILKAIHAES